MRRQSHVILAGKSIGHPSAESAQSKSGPSHNTNSSRTDKALGRKICSTFSRHTPCALLQIVMFNCFTWLERYDPQVGYCQGLPFVVAILLLNVSDSVTLDGSFTNLFNYYRCPTKKHFACSSDLCTRMTYGAISYPRCPSCNCAL